MRTLRPTRTKRTRPEPPQPPALHATMRELARRKNDGLEVVLLWHPTDDAVTVSVADARSGNGFAFPVPGAHALDAFRHPFAYAP